MDVMSVNHRNILSSSGYLPQRQWHENMGEVMHVDTGGMWAKCR